MLSLWCLNSCEVESPFAPLPNCAHTLTYTQTHPGHPWAFGHGISAQSYPALWHLLSICEACCYRRHAHLRSVFAWSVAADVGCEGVMSQTGCCCRSTLKYHDNVAIRYPTSCEEEMKRWHDLQLCSFSASDMYFKDTANNYWPG